LRGFATQLDPNVTPMTYSNYALADDERAAKTSAITQLKKLRETKSEYGPHNLFTRNHFQKLI
jgi:hypothetical protein